MIISCCHNDKEDNDDYDDDINDDENNYDISFLYDMRLYTSYK
jgi:hypothetical protein